MISTSSVNGGTEQKHKEKMEVAVGLEPTKIGFAGQRLDHFGIATSEKSVPKSIPRTVPKLPSKRLFTPFKVSVNY